VAGAGVGFSLGHPGDCSQLRYQRHSGQPPLTEGSSSSTAS
jgi:hypothetical protein